MRLACGGDWDWTTLEKGGGNMGREGGVERFTICPSARSWILVRSWSAIFFLVGREGWGGWVEGDVGLEMRMRNGERGWGLEP